MSACFSLSVFYYSIQPNTSGFLHLGNHNCLASDFTGTSLDFAFTHGNSSPDLLAPFAEPYQPLPPSSVPGSFFNSDFDTASLDIFAGLQDDPLLFALDGANNGSNYSDESPDNLFSQPNMYNESFLAATLNPTSGFSSSAGGKRKRPASGDEPADESLADKRRRNNLAAAKYRQKKVDRITELEDEVKEVSKERDELKLQLARRDAELELLRKLMMDRK
ncbi:hypothetical protein SLS58_008406 [Diplodia intermedia]|uniref:BZIP domain-containing protein n=1 Tax=Diplodia intermedia TaxID=856260 RepID=A0ABR3THC9_9PEZI